MQAQQHSLYCMKNIWNPNWRKLFIDALEKLVTDYRLDNVDLFIACNFNETIGLSPTEMAQVFCAGDLTDVYTHHHGV